MRWMAFSMLFFLKVLKENTNASWILYLLTSMLSIYTHFSAIFFILSQILFFVCNFKKYHHILKRMLFFYGILTISFSPLFFYYLTIITKNQSFVTGIVFGRGASWVYKSTTGLAIRAGSLVLNPNEIAVILPMLLPLFFYSIESRKTSRIVKYLYTLGIPVLVLTTVLTLSRMGFICLIVAFFLIFRKKLNPNHLLSMGIMVTILLLFTPNAYFERILSTVSKDTSGQGRLLIWQGAVDMIQAYPLTGVGYGQFMRVFHQFQPYLMPEVAHNSYLSIAAETGLLNLAIYFSLILVTFLDLRKLGREAMLSGDIWLTQISKTLRSCLTIILIGGMTMNTNHFVVQYIIIALVVVLRRLWQEHREINIEHVSKFKEDTLSRHVTANCICIGTEF